MQAKRRYQLTDAQWARLEPLLPPEKPWTGRPNDDHRQILNGILWVLNSGAPWRDLPRRDRPGGPGARPGAPRRPGGPGVEPVLPLAAVGCVAARAGGVAGSGRRWGAGRLGTALPGQHGRTSTPPGRARRVVNPAPRTRRSAARAAVSRSTCAARA